MRFNIGRKDWPIFLFALFIFCVKVPFLSVPLYWDESIYFVPAMFQQGLSSLVLPHYNPELFHGHPPLFQIQLLLFSFFFSSEVMASHAAALFNTIAFVFIAYGFLKKRAGPTPAFFAVFMFYYYPHIFSMATQVHPNTMMLAFGLLALDSYMEKKIGAFCAFAVLAALTRESAIAFFLMPLLNSSWQFLKKRVSWKEVAASASPFALLVLFFTYNKLASGTFVNHPYVSHRIGADKINLQAFLDSIPLTADHLKVATIDIFPYWSLPLLAMFGIFYLMDKRRSLWRRHKEDIIYLGAPALIFLIFYFAYSDTIVRDFYFPTFVVAALAAVFMKHTLQKIRWQALFVTFMVAGTYNLHFLQGGQDWPYISYHSKAVHLKKVADKIGAHFPEAEGIKVAWPGLNLFQKSIYGHLPRDFHTTYQDDEADILVVSDSLVTLGNGAALDLSVWKLRYKLGPSEGILESKIYEKR